MSAVAPRLDLTALIDERPVGRFQVWLFVLLGASVVMDGFDAQAMGFVAPAVIKAWGVDKAALGPVFGASLMGMLVGSLVLSPLADRIGRRPVLIGSTLFFGACMLAHAARARSRATLRHPLRDGPRPRRHHGQRDGPRGRITARSGAA